MPSCSKQVREDEEIAVVALAYNLIKKKKMKRKHRWWVHQLNQRRKEQGAFENLVRELHDDEERFQQYFRLTRDQFCQVLNLVGRDLSKHCPTREVISPRQRLAICLR